MPIAVAVAVIARLPFGGGCNSGYHQGTFPGRACQAVMAWCRAASPVAVVWRLSLGSGELFMAVGAARAPFAAVG